MPITADNISSIKSTWFDEFIAMIRTHQLLLETNTATEDIKKIYGIAINGSDNQLAELNKISANQHFIKKIIVSYLNEIESRMPLKLAFDLDDSEVLVWAEIENNDDEAENFLLLAEASVNSDFHKYGYDLTSTIVEERDCLAIPNHYSLVKSK
ncbi:MAG TPA: hypothetical protein VMU83_10710 [Hanamia sp.]|nr:hypothetical protein [Hanamia sp.]